VAQATGGRVLSPDAEKADLFSRQGITFPRASQPLTRELFIAWLALFLLDVAVRRVAFNLRAVGRRLAGMFRPGRKADEGRQTLQQLRTRRKEVREAMAEKAADTPAVSAGARYAGGETADSDVLPMADASAAKPTPAAATKSQAGASASAADGNHMNRLLRAKQAARDRMAEGTKDHDP